MKEIDNNDNNDKYNNNRHISIEINYFEKTETNWDEYDNKVKFAFEL